MTKQVSSASERIGKAIVELRRNPYNRALQRKIYLVGTHELTPVQVDILEAVIGDPGRPMNELARTLGVDASTVSRTILPLVRLGLVEQRREAKDRRLTRLFPTAVGLNQGAIIAEAKRSMMQAVQPHFSPADLERFADLLEHYVEAITQVGIMVLGEVRQRPTMPERQGA